MIPERAHTRRAHTERAHAKLNLMLRVLAREESGFHQLETILCAVELADEIEVCLEGDVVSLDVVALRGATGTPQDLGPVEKNLAWRAATLFNAAAGLPPDAAGVRIRLIKRIPAGAGLGGGSSDAAAVLRALNRLHDAPLSADALLQLGGRIGSDVPYFLTGAPLALGWGRGGRLLPLPPLPPAHVLLVVPRESVPTGDAYGALAQRREETPETHAAGVAAALLHAPRTWGEAASLAHNDFEPIIFQRLPHLSAMRDAVAAGGASVARLTGTGSVVFGTFDDPAMANEARAAVEDAFPDAQLILTRTMGTPASGAGMAEGTDHA